MSDPTGNANQGDKQGEITNVVPFPSDLARHWNAGEVDANAPEAGNPRAPRVDPDAQAPAADDGCRRTDCRHPRCRRTGCRHPRPTDAADNRAADAPAADGPVCDLIGADSFWDGDSAWLHQPMSEPLDPATNPEPDTRTDVPASEPALPATALPAAFSGSDVSLSEAEIERSAEANLSAHSSSPSAEAPLADAAKPRAPMSRVSLLAWCASVLAVLILLGGVLPQLVKFPAAKRTGSSAQLARGHEQVAGHSGISESQTKAGVDGNGQAVADVRNYRPSDARPKRKRHPQARRHSHKQRPATNQQATSNESATSSDSASYGNSGSADTGASSATDSGATADSTYSGSSGGGSTGGGTNASSGSSGGGSSGSASGGSGSGSSGSGSSGCSSGTESPVGCRGNAP